LDTYVQHDQKRQRRSEQRESEYSEKQVTVIDNLMFWGTQGRGKALPESVTSPALSQPERADVISERHEQTATNEFVIG
jgi:hypothetical protein